MSAVGFAPPYDVPVPYLQRVRSYYQVLGYGAPYEWAHYAEVPFQPLGKPLSRCRIALITTAAPYQPGKGDQGPGAPYNAAAKFYAVYSGDTAQDHDLRISHIAIDRQHTTAEDPATYFPLAELRRSAAAGRIGGLTARFHGAPTNRSQRATLEVDGPEIVARMLEDSGMATVVMGCARDIVELVGVPRLLFSDFPLGNAAGRPRDPASQAFTLELALKLLEAAPAARTTVQSPLRWADSAEWKLDYCNIDRLTPAEIQRRRAEFDGGKAQAQALRSAAGITRRDGEDPGTE